MNRGDKMTPEETRKYILEKYGVDVDTIEKVVIPESEWKNRQPYYDLEQSGNSIPFIPQPHNPIKTSGKKPYRQKLTKEDILKEML